MNQKTGETTNTVPTEVVKVELSPDEAQLFIDFQKHHKEFSFMVRCGVFDVKGSNAVLHFDDDGKLRRIQVLKGFIF